MTFAFVSHAQPDKMRPDRRMRELTHYLYQSGIPLWIDRPEELGLDARALEHRCVALNGVWTNDIRDALKRCNAGLGIWSLHAANRMRVDVGGVLSQEMTTLSLSSRLNLVSIDPGIAAGASQALTHLAGGQQVIDLSVDQPVLVRRLARLIAALAAVTNAKHSLTKHYIAALGDKAGKLGASSSLLQPEAKRARAAAETLLAAFAAHNPGRLAIGPTPELVAAYERVLSDCRRSNTRFRTYHRLVALMQMPSHFVQGCFDALEPGLGARVQAWLSKQTSNETYIHVEPLTDTLANAAIALAEAERAPAADERHFFLAILRDGGSGTAGSIRNLVGRDKYETLVACAQQRRPQTPAFTQTAPLEKPD